MRKDLIDFLPWLKSIRPVLTLVDPLAVAVAGLVVREHVTVLSVAGAALAGTIVCRGADLHRSRLVLSVLEDVPKLLVATLVSALTLVGISPLHALADRPSWTVLGLFAGVTFALLVLMRAAAYAGAHSMRRSGRSSHPVIIVGAGVVGRRLAEAFIAKRDYGLVPVGMIDCSPDVSARDLPIPLLGGVADLERAMLDLGVDDVIFAFPGPPDDQTISAVRDCVQNDRQVFVVPRFFEVMGMDHHRRVEVVSDVAVMRLRRSGLRPHSMLLKRLLDLTLSSLALAVLAPVLLACAIAVRLETGPGVIFRQTRVGIGGRNFTLFKFRSLKPATELESATQWNVDLDHRLGPVGRFLRRTSLDELPQLVNVLRGDMSLVGPRPERPFFVREFSQQQHRYDDRHRVQTGLTGWAQVNDLRGDTSIGDRVRFDNYYIANWSLWGDIKIMFRTVAALGRSQPAAWAVPIVALPASTVPAALPASTVPAALPAPQGRRGSGRRSRHPVPLTPASLRVVHVSMPTSEGVAEVVMAYVRDQLARGWDVTVVCPSTGRLGYAAREAGASVVWWQATRNPGPATLHETVRLRRILAAARPDLVHLHSAKAGLAGRLALRGRIPTIFQPHAWSFQAATGAVKLASTWWERWAGRWTSELVCVSDSELALGRRAGVTAACATVVPNGVAAGSIRAVGRTERAAARATLGLANVPTVVCIGRLAPQKGQQDLLDAWPLVRARIPQAQLILVGEGPDRPVLEDRISPSSGVSLVGARTDVPVWLTAADVVVAPSRWEGMALAPLEAMACGRSVVAADVVGIEGSIPPNAGVLVDAAAPDALAAALVERLDDPDLADAEGLRGRAHVQANLGTSAPAASLATISRRLAGTRTRALASSN